PILWKKIKKGLSAGRGRTVAWKMIIEREKAIKNFKPEEYWSINAQFLKGKDTFQGKFNGITGKKKEIKNETSVKEIIEQVTEEQFTIYKVNKRERKRNPAKPFITSSLQPEAARKLKFRARKTMIVAQQLYEGID